MKNKSRFLIVDDDDGDLTLMRNAIETAGFDADVYVAKNGEQGVEMVDDLKPVTVIVDTNMPGINGFETCSLMKSRDKVNIQVIICTGVVDAVDAGKARASGADGYCVKTSNYEALINEIKSMF
ncbi:MAG: response regulator [Candidatus Omnitrophica bacterium]|nr:response regulator [Candidatus Omnitrophota bacterium]